MEARKRKRWKIGLALVGVAGSVWLIPRRWMSVNDVTTGQTPAYPEIVPCVYALPPNPTFDAAKAACAALPRWRVVETDAQAFRLHAEVRIPVFGFIDDVTVWIEPNANGSRVMIRSHSRVGKGDLGENARHIRALQAEMDRHLPPL